MGGPRLPITNPGWWTAAILIHRQRINRLVVESLRVFALASGVLL